MEEGAVGRQGLFISFEGPEGSGKTTQAGLLADRLRAAGLTTHLTREPGGTELGERVRAILLHAAELHPTQAADALLFAAARAQLVAEVIRPRLAAGAVVICDRYADSSLAYQGIAYGQSLELVRSLQEFATGGLWPDLTLLLDVAPRDGLGRKRAAADENRFEDQFDADFHQRVRAAYRELAEAAPGRWAVVDASGPTASVSEEIRRVVAERLPALARPLGRAPDPASDPPITGSGIEPSALFRRTVG